MSVVIPFASPGCICAIASSTPPPASSGPLVHLPPRAHTSTPSRRSIWPVDTSPAMSPPNPDFKCCKLLQVESDEAHLKKCDASPVSPTGDAGVRRSECCKAHIEPVRRLVSHDFVRDVIIGLSDGLMVPFALTAGLSSLGSSKLVYQGGFAELIAGAISMGIGGYLSAKSEQDIFRHRLAAISDRLNVACAPEIGREVHDVLGAFGVQPGVSRLVAENLEVAQREEAAKKDVAIRPDERSHHVSALPFLGTPTPLSYLARRRKAATRGTSAFLIQLGEGMEEVTTLRLFVSAFTIGLSYFLGGLIPIIPYFCVPDALHGLYWSILATGITLILFGLTKSWFTGAATGALGLLWGAVSMLAVGAAAAAASYGIVKALAGANAAA